METGTEALDGAPKKSAEKPARKAGKSAAKPKREIHHIISRPHKDGSVGHVHIMKGKDGHPDLTSAPEEYSSANADDAGAHVAQALGGGADQGAADPGAAAAPSPDAAPPAAAAAVDPGAAAAGE